jgi:hypothetical protein
VDISVVEKTKQERRAESLGEAGFLQKIYTAV